MATYERIGVAMFFTIALMIGGLVYNRVFVSHLVPLVDPNGTFSQPVFLLERLVPVILAVLLLATWAWVVAGAVQDEQRVSRRRLR